MSSYFALELDTTAPKLTITMPRRSIPQNVMEIEIKSNEPLGTYQEIYMINNEGNRNDYIFYKFDDFTYIGYIDLQNYPLGIASLHVRLKDDVDNLSDSYINYINIGYIQYKYETMVDLIDRKSTIDIIHRNNKMNIIKRKSSLEVV